MVSGSVPGKGIKVGGRKIWAKGQITGSRCEGDELLPVGRGNN